MKTFQRILAVVLCLVMSLSVLGTVAFAAEGDPQTTAATIDTSKKGSITVHKYEYNGTNKGTGTGEVQTVPSDAEALAGVTFALYQVMTQDQMLAYYNGTDASSVTVNTFVSTNDAGEYVVTNKGGNLVTATTENIKTTDSTGVVSFTDLALGMYVIIETSAPAKVTVAEKPFLVSVPMTKSTTDADWLYDINVYPKNSTSEGGINLIKKGEGDALLEAQFLLQKKVDNTWTNIDTYTTSTTNTSGIAIENLAHGEYQLIEQSVTAEGYVVDKTPITFTIDANSTVTYTSTTRANVTAAGSGGKAMTITVTNEKPDVTKEVTENTNATPGVGETVEFTVTVEVPTNIADMTAFTVADAPVNLVVTDDSVAVLDGSTAVSTDLYDVNYDGEGFVLTFKVTTDGLDFSSIAGKTLTITYDAVVQESAASVGTTGNEVTLTYDDGVREQTDTADTTQKYFKIDITKWKDAANTSAGSVAAGVEFKLYSDAAMTNEVKVYGTVGSYIYDADGTADATMVTDSDGKLVVSGLPAGTYYLKETKAPDGYNLLKEEITISLNEKDVTALSYELDVINKKGFDLPQTGGIGTLMFIIIGGVLIAGGICLITVPNKKRSV